jgi:hypothetical protein
VPDRRRDDPRERTTSLAFGSARLGWRRMHMHVRWPGARFAKWGAGRGSRARRLPMSRSRRTWTRAARYCDCDGATANAGAPGRSEQRARQAIERASTHVDVPFVACMALAGSSCLPGRTCGCGSPAVSVGRQKACTYGGGLANADARPDPAIRALSRSVAFSARADAIARPAGHWPSLSRTLIAEDDRSVSAYRYSALFPLHPRTLL